MPAEPDRPENGRAKLFLRGTVTNSIGLFVLFALSRIHQGFELYVGIALGIQWLVFLLHALPFNSEKLYDLSGSFTHLAVVAASLCAIRMTRSPRQMLLSLASVVWMTRLGTFLYLRILKDGRDPRFDALKRVWLAFVGAWTIQACWVCLIQLPILLINSGEDPAPVGVADALALLLWATGFVLECAADIEKYTFRLDPANRERFITSGMWRYSRHPNYFGEILIWCAMAIATSAAGLRASNLRLLWAWLSPAFTAFLLLKVSGVPMVEAAGKKKWGDSKEYAHYMAHTSLLVPWRPAPPLAAPPLL